MASKIEALPHEDKGGAPETADLEPPPDTPLLDLSDAAVRTMVKQAKNRGYVIHDQFNSAMLLEKATSEQIEDVLAMLNEMGIRVVEIEEAEPDEEEQCAEAEEESEEGAIIELQRTTPAKVKKPELPERTDDPVRMYLREGSVELLSREGEIAIDKRIEGGREAMIAAPPAAPVGPTPFQPAAGANTTAPTAKAGTRARKPRSPIPVSTPEELSLPIRCSSSRDGVPTASVRDAGRLNMSLRSDRRRLDRYRP